MILSKRLEKVLEMITTNKIVADIGCDHAMLPIELIKRGISPKVYAIDNKTGPLEGAKANLVKSGIKTKVELVLGDGLKNLPYDVELVNIAGVGGLLAIDMLKNASRIPDELVLQVNNHIDDLRRYLNQSNYEIVDEAIIYDASLYYEIIKVKIGKINNLSEEDILFGPILRRKKEQLFIDKWLIQIEHLKNILKSLNDENQDKIREINEKIVLISNQIY